MLTFKGWLEQESKGGSETELREKKTKEKKISKSKDEKGWRMKEIEG